MTDNTEVRSCEENRVIQEKLNKKASHKKLINSIIPYVGLVFIIVFFEIVTDGMFLSYDNMENLVNQGFVLMLIAIGSAFVYAHGGMDFSIGAVSGVAQLACGVLLLAGKPLWICIFVAILICVLGGSLTSMITLFLGVPVFVGSLCVRQSFQGILKTFCETSEIAIDYTKYGFINGTWVKVIILVVSIGLCIYLFNYTKIGKYNKALGGNILTAIQAGVNKKKYIFIAYIIMGLCVGIASVFAFFRSGKVTSYSGNGYEFNIMMAIILGGFPMSGGEKSKMTGAIIGALTVTCLTNGLGLWGLDSTLVTGVKGILFVAIVALSYDRSAGKLVN